MQKAVLYARTSSQDKSERLEDQLALCRSYCETKGYFITQEISEDDATGTDISLPGLEQVRDLARNQEFNILVVRDLDRLSRSLVKQLILEDELRRYNVRVEYVLADFDDTPEGQLQKHIRATVAEFERAKIHERTNRGIRQALKRGSTVSGGKGPYGYLVTKTGEGGQQFVLDPREAQIVRLIFHWFVVSKIPAYQIAQRLTERRIPTWSENPNRPRIKPRLMPSCHWTATVVLRVVKNRTYIGEWVFGKGTSDPIVVSVPPIITKATYDQAQRQCIINKRRTIGRTTKALLVRRMYCGDCGYKMHLRGTYKKIRRAYYTCPSNQRDNVRECSLPSFRVDLVDHHVWRWVAHLLCNSPDILDQAADMYQTPPTPLFDRLNATTSVIQERTEAWENLIETIKHTTGRAKAVIAADLQSLEDQIDQLEHEKRDLQEKLETFESTAKNLRALGRAIQAWQIDVAGLQNSYRGQRRVIEMLDITGTLRVINQERVIDVNHNLTSLNPPTRLPLTPLAATNPSPFFDTTPKDCIKEQLLVRLFLKPDESEHCSYEIKMPQVQHENDRC